MVILTSLYISVMYKSTLAHLLQISVWSHHHPTSMMHSLIAYIHPKNYAC